MPGRRIHLRKGLVAAVACGLAAAAAFAHMTRNHWVEVPLEAVLTICFAVPAAVLWSVAFALGRRGGQSWLAQCGKLCLALIVFVAASWAGLPLRAGLAWYDQKKAREFCEFLVPTIERYRADHAGYPDDVNWMVSEQGYGKPPKLIENGFQYHRRDGSFVLAFVAPDRPFAWHVFESNQATWNLEFD